jgi:F-type H+-transporting ATPase subunit b
VLIDWFTVIAQIVNFLILVALLKKFLYGPIIRAMDSRASEISERLNNAQERENEAEQELESYRRKNEELDQKREELLHQAREEAEERKKELLKDARDEVEEKRSGWQEVLQREKVRFLDNLRSRIGDQVIALSRQTLRDLADARLEEQVLQVFLQRIENLDAGMREELASSMTSSREDVVVTSAFEVTPEWRDRIVQSLPDAIVDGRSVHFASDSDLLCGIQLKAGGHKVDWSLKGYLDDLEREFADMLDEEGRQKPGVPRQASSGSEGHDRREAGGGAEQSSG